MNDIDREAMTLTQLVRERNELLAALQQIASTDSRYGVHMQETAAAAVLKFLESLVTT